MDMTISSLQRDAFEKAEAYYLTHWNDNHTRKDPTDDWDESRFIAWARLWLVCMHTYDRMNGGSPIGGGFIKEYHEELHDAYSADFEECLVAMYG